MMHPVFIGATLKPESGYGTLARTHCEAFHSKKIPFTLLLPRYAERLRVPYAESVRYVLPDLPLNFSSLPDLPRLFRFHMPIRWLGPVPTLVHSLLDFPYAVLGRRIARTRRIPFFFSALGTYSVAPFKRHIDRALFMPAYRDAERIFAISGFTADAMKKAAGFKRHVDTVYLPVSDGSSSARTCFFPWLPSDARVILSVGPLKERKGMDVLVRAMPRVLRSIPDAHLVIAAAYGDEAPYRALAESGAVSGRVHFARNPSAAELSGLFARADVFAMTPRYVENEFEGYGLVYVEAGWHGLPVVASRSGGVPEAVIDGVTGLLAPENDAEATATALVSVLTDGAFAKRLGRAGYARAAGRTPARYVEDLLRLYDTHGKP